MINKLIGFFVLLIILYLIYYIRKSRNNSPMMVGNKHDSTKLLTFSNNIIPFSKTNEGLTYTISFWSYIKNWDDVSYKKKEILNWVDNLMVYYESKNNNLGVKIKLINGKYEKFNINNITLQKWNNIIVIVNNRYIDIFVNSNLEKSVHLTTLPNYSRNILNVCSNGGYKGYISNLRFYNYALNLFNINYIGLVGPFMPNFMDFLFKVKPRAINTCI